MTFNINLKKKQVITQVTVMMCTITASS